MTNDPRGQRPNGQSPMGQYPNGQRPSGQSPRVQNSNGQRPNVQRPSMSAELDRSIGEQPGRPGNRKKILRPTRHRRFRLNPAVAIMLLLFALMIGVCIMFSLRSDEPQDNPDVPGMTTDAVGDSADEAEKDAAIEVLDGFEKITVPTSDVHEGDLILVNYAYAHVLPEDNDISSVFDYKSKSYKVSNTATQMSRAVTEKFNILMDDFYANSGCRDVMVVSGYRSVEDQQRIYQDRVETDGAEEAAKYVAVPGYSEHHTGLAMDLTVYLSDGTSHYLLDYAPAQWFRDHAHEYGFILRYPEDKAEITKISYESWHYRYVGAPHSVIITDKGMCLEEYVEYLRGFEYGERYLAYTSGTVSETDTFPADADAVIYRIGASSGETTELCVPEGWEYTVSGDNVDGFVVTAYRK